MSEAAREGDPGVAPRASSALDALGHPEFRWFFAGTVSGNLALWMLQLALGWLVIQIAIRDGNPERGAFYLGLTGLARLFPALAFGLVGGVTADRFDRRRVLIATQVVPAVAAGALAVLTLTDRITIALVMALTAVSATALAIEGPTRFALVQMVVSRRAAFSALGLTRAAMQTSSMIGPLVGGLLILPLGVGGVIVVTALLYALSGFGLGRIKPTPAPPRAGLVNPLDSFRQGLSYVRHQPTLRGFMTTIVVFSVVGSSYGQLLPAVAHDTLGVGALELSWLAAASGAGALAGTLALTTMGRWPRPGRTLLLDAFAVGVVLVLFGLQRSLWLTAVMVALVSFTTMIYGGGSGTIIQMTAPDQLRGRVMGVYTMVYQSGVQLGILALGIVGSLVGISTALSGAGIVVLLMAVAISRVAAIRDYGERTPEPDRAASGPGWG